MCGDNKMCGGCPCSGGSCTCSNCGGEMSKDDKLTCFKKKEEALESRLKKVREERAALEKAS